MAAPVWAKTDMAEFDVAVLRAPEGTPLAEILSGRARVGFTPLLGLGAPLKLQADQATWVRLRAELPAHANGEWLLWLEQP